MRKLYFKNSRGDKRVIAEVENESEAIKEIYSFCEERNFKVYYVRSHATPDGFIEYDCGSWSEFFYLEI